MSDDKENMVEKLTIERMSRELFSPRNFLSICFRRERESKEKGQVFPWGEDWGETCFF